MICTFNIDIDEIVDKELLAYNLEMWGATNIRFTDEETK